MTPSATYACSVAGAVAPGGDESDHGAVKARNAPTPPILKVRYAGEQLYRVTDS